MKEKEHISSGSHSINIGSKNSIANSSLHVGDVHNHGDFPAKPKAFIGRVTSTPANMLGVQLKAGWLTVSGVIGFIGSVASIVSYWQHLSFWFVLLFAFVMFLLVSGSALIRQRFIRIPYLPYNIEADKSGRVFITKIEGDCPMCDGKLKLRDIGPRDNQTTYVRCTRNPDHIWDFDFTVLDEPKADI